MKVVLIGTAHPYRGGLAVFNERLIRQFQNEGHEAEIMTFTLQYPSLLFPGKTQYSTEPKPSDLKIVRCVNSINPFNWLRVGRKLRKMQPDIVIFKFWLPFMAPCFGTIARIARRNRTTKVVSVLDNVIPHEKRIGDRAFARYFVNSVDGFVAMSHSVQDDLGQFDTVKPRTLCPHPLFDAFGEKADRDAALDFLGLDKNTRYMLFFGLIRDYKGLDLLLEAMADERLKSKNVKLIVAGEFYNNEEQYHEMERSLGLEGKIVWHSQFVPDSEVKYFFAAADIIVQPYKSATQSGVTQIAYHFEKPMLVTNVGGLSESITGGKVGYIIEPQPNTISESLVDFYENDRYETFVEGVKEEKKKYQWSNMTAAILKLL